MRRALPVGCLALLAVFVTLGSLLDAPPRRPPPGAEQGPWFEVHVVKPRVGRPLGGLLPEGRWGIPPAELIFDRDSPGAEVVRFDDRRLALRADGWELTLAADADGRVGGETRVVFPIELAERERVLRGRPGEPVVGRYTLTPRVDGALCDASFDVEIARCVDATTGADVAWPAQPLRVHGVLRGLARTDR